MNILEVHRKEKNPTLNWNAPSYYDHPDGQDLMGKLSFVCKHTTVVGILLGVLTTNAPPKTNSIGKLIRITRYTLPAAAMGFVFTSVTYCSTIIRGKDDPINHTLGGIAAGLILGPACGVPGFSTVGAVLIGGLACLNKNFNMAGHDIRGRQQKLYHGSYYKRSLDFSALPEIKGNWTKDP